MNTRMRQSAREAKLTLEILTTQEIKPATIPKHSIVTCTKCGASWAVVTDQKRVTRRDERGGSIRRKTWRLCPHGCNASRLAHSRRGCNENRLTHSRPKGSKRA